MRQQLWGNSTTQILCVWKELSPKVRVCGRKRGTESRNWHVSWASLRQRAVSEAVPGEDRHCHVSLGQRMRGGGEVWTSSSVSRGLRGLVSGWEFGVA